MCVSNFAGNPHEGYRVGLPFGGEWVEILNTDAEEFGGSGVVNVGTIIAEDTPWNGRPVSASLRVPPLGALVAWCPPPGALIEHSSRHGRGRGRDSCSGLVRCVLGPRLSGARRYHMRSIARRMRVDGV